MGSGLDLSTKYTREFAGYVSNQFIINENLSIRAGLRLTTWQNVGPATEYDIVKTTGGDFERDSLAVLEHPDGKVYHQSFSLDPRLSMIWQAGQEALPEVELQPHQPVPVPDHQFHQSLYLPGGMAARRSQRAAPGGGPVHHGVYPAIWQHGDQF